MSLKYKIVPDHKLVYVRGAEKVTADDILTEGARMFAESEWENGYSILCDYRAITDFNLNAEDIFEIAKQDKNNELLFDQSKCAIIANRDLVYGLSRMWEIISETNKIETMIFRNIEDSIRWLGMDAHVFHLIKGLP